MYVKLCTYVHSTKLKIIDAEDSMKLQAIGCPGMIQFLYIVACTYMYMFYVYCVSQACSPEGVL